MVLLRPALRSTAFGRRLSSGGPSIPLPQACCLETNSASPGLGGLWWGGGNDLAAKPILSDVCQLPSHMPT
mgnify:CR=1 FL=1